MRSWEEDPGSGVPPVTMAAPDPAGRPLAYRFATPAPAADEYAVGTPAFRYWVAVEALRRGAAFFAPRVPGGRWQLGAVLPIRLDAGEDLNAYYDRRALHFFHAPTAGGIVYSGESPDILCHEMGHAILDSVKPQLWDAASLEVAAFHESFGDMSSILCALQLPSLRRAVLADTGGRLYRASRLSRLAEQLGAAVRAQHPDAVDPDCLRNAVNTFIYQDPLTLPYSAPAAQLSAESHSFSRVFTAAFLQSLGGMLAASARSPKAPTEQELLQVSHDMGDILMAGVAAAPVRPDFYAQVAAAMVEEAAERNSGYARALRATFARRGILPVAPPARRNRTRKAPRSASRRRSVLEHPLGCVHLNACDFGFQRGTLRITTASHAPVFASLAGGRGADADTADAAPQAARAFVEHLFRRDRVDVGRLRTLAASSPHALKTHCVVRTDGELRLQRRLFDCGCRHG
ncbi:MAG: hypothetical protein IT480_18075 [Gammaproteobacteria bacterium]|nr:hypothetical protein [Gammaproteobacteria bacterium]